MALLPLQAVAQSTMEAVLDGEAERDTECRAFMQHRSSCAKDSECTAMRAGCGDHAVSKADAPRFTDAASSCSGMACPMVVSPPSIPVCEASRCVMRSASSTWGNPLTLCLERHLERFPRDTARVTVKVTPREGGGVSATSPDRREVARCLEGVLERLGSAKNAATLEFVPGAPLPGPPQQANQPRVVGTPYSPTERTAPRLERMVVNRDAGND